MKTVNVTMVRIYTLERSETVPTILNYLQNEVKIRGISVFRAMSGFGETGVHMDAFLNLSFSLPLVIEFFDHPEKVALALEYLSSIIKSEHLVMFPAQANA